MAQVSLRFGADDRGGTVILEEKIYHDVGRRADSARNAPRRVGKADPRRR